MVSCNMYKSNFGSDFNGVGINKDKFQFSFSNPQSTDP